MRVILLRHGETAWNRDGVFRGTEDVPLNDLGRKQAALAGQRLQDSDVRRIYTSSLSRARETALLAAQHSGIPVEEKDFLLDMYFGQWQGLTVEEVASRWPAEYGIWQNQPQLCQSPGGESLEGVMQRAARGVETLLQGGEKADLILVTHRVIIKLLLLWALGGSSKDFWKIRVDTCSISSFLSRKDYFVIEKINDTCHLRQLAPPPAADF